MQDFSRDGLGRTLLHWAAFCGDSHIVIDLLKQGAKADIKDNDGVTLPKLAEKYPQIQELFKSFEDTKIFLQKIQSFLQFDFKSDKDKHLRKEFKKLMDDNIELINRTLSDTGTVLHYFAQAGFPRYVWLLVNMKADCPYATKMVTLLYTLQQNKIDSKWCATWDKCFQT